MLVHNMPLHPFLVHLPLALAFVVPVLGIGILWAWARGHFPRTAWLIIVMLEALLVLGGFAAMRAGEEEEERVEEFVSEHFIEEHEEAAEAFVWMHVGTLIITIAAFALSRTRERQAQLAAAVSIAAMGVGAYLAYRTGLEGGALVYEHGAANSSENPNKPNAAE